MSERVGTFRNVRARMLHADEGRWYAAWTKHLSQEEVRLRLKAYVPLRPGTRVMGECYGDGALVRFVGLLRGQMGQEVAVAVCGSLGFERSHETIRVGVEGVSGRLLGEDFDEEIILSDVSPSSLGGYSPLSLRTETEVDLVVDTRLGPIENRARVVYCRAEPGDEANHRLGLRIVEASRLDAARWARFVRDMTQS